MGELHNTRKNGEEYIAHSTISPILDENGEVEFFVGIERDITKDYEVDKAKTEFVSLASHQLRTPLSAINWYTEMLLEGDAGKVTKEQKKYLKEIYAGNQRMVELVNALLNVSRIELGTIAFEPENVKLDEIMQSVLKEVAPQLKSKKIKLEKKFSTLPKIKLDPKIIRIVFQNLITNAVKYTPSNGSITVSISKLKGKARIIVKDSGYGIPKKQQDKIFTKLFRADNVREKETDGTGLGLYIVKSIIEQMGGSISFTSKENKGTTFTVLIPLKGIKKKDGSKGLI